MNRGDGDDQFVFKILAMTAYFGVNSLFIMFTKDLQFNENSKFVQAATGHGYSIYQIQKKNVDNKSIQRHTCI